MILKTVKVDSCKDCTHYISCYTKDKGDTLTEIDSGYCDKLKVRVVWPEESVKTCYFYALKI